MAEPNGRGGWDLTDDDVREIARASGWETGQVSLTGFLRARLDEDEATAREASGLDPTTDSYAVDVFIGRFSPARVLREVEAKREHIASLLDLTVEMDKMLADDDADPVERAVVIGRRIQALAVVKGDAAIHSDHPDYQQRWAPAKAPGTP